MAGMPLTWEGSGINEKAYDKDGIERVCVNPEFFRPAEVELLLGDSKKAQESLAGKVKIQFEDWSPHGRK